ncbi:hypothetical protein [Fibrella aestuarina]|nr:hypothetical protein [Fibrella aestuarina]
MVQYPLNDEQTLLVFHTPQEPDALDGHGQIEWIPLGRLDDQSFIIESMTRNSLIRDGWDFDKYPNPYVAIGNPIEQSHE